jgi:hypothetical protein
VSAADAGGEGLPPAAMPVIRALGALLLLHGAVSAGRALGATEVAGAIKTVDEVLKCAGVVQP